MTVLLTGLFLGMWGLMIWWAPKHKRFSHRRGRNCGYSEVDGDENAEEGIADSYCDAGSDGGGDCGGGDGGGD